MKEKKKYGLFARPHMPRSGTRSAEAFVSSWLAINRFFHFVVGMVSHVDSAADRAHHVLVDTAKTEEEKLKLQSSWKTRASATDALRANRQFFVEIVLVRHVENYLNFVSSILHEIFIQRPETLRSSEKIEVSVALQADSIESLVRDLAERKVESLSYSSFTELAAFFDERFKLELVTAEQLKAFLEAIEVRNISVHNRCLINKRYNARLKLPNDRVGQLKVLGIDDLESLVPLLAQMALSLDQQARLKFKLRRVRFAKERFPDAPKRTPV